MLSTLIYVSVRSAQCNEAEIEKILQASIRNNGNIDITGVLLYSDKKFLQVLEGEYSQIISLYDKIKEDPRHKNVVMVALRNIKERTFPSWQMGAKKININEIEFKTDMTRAEKNEFLTVLDGNSENVSKSIELIKKFF